MRRLFILLGMISNLVLAFAQNDIINPDDEVFDRYVSVDEPISYMGRDIACDTLINGWRIKYKAIYDSKLAPRPDRALILQVYKDEKLVYKTTAFNTYSFDVWGDVPRIYPLDSVAIGQVESNKVSIVAAYYYPDSDDGGDVHITITEDGDFAWRFVDFYSEDSW